MKTNKSTLIVAATIAGFLFLGTAYAEDKAAKTAQSHEEHHPDAQAAPKDDTGSDAMGKGGMMSGDMMGKMDMNQMMGMMHECMSMHQDGKMCDQQTMDKCQEKMGKRECKKMMKQARAREKSQKK